MIRGSTRTRAGEPAEAVSILGPYYPEWGADPALAKLSLQKLIDLKADILCEGHFGIYQPASEVKRYIQQYVDFL